MSAYSARLYALVLLMISAIQIAYAIVVGFVSSWRMAVVILVVAGILCLIAVGLLIAARVRERKDDER